MISPHILGVKCLARALVAQVMLSSQGYPNQLRIGVGKDNQGQFIAHAWVENRGRTVIGGIGNMTQHYQVMSLPEWEQIYTQKNHAIAIISTSCQWSYQELSNYAYIYADILDNCGLIAGDRIILELETCPQAIALIIACSLLGLVFIPVSPESPLARVEQILIIDAQMLLLDDKQQEINQPNHIGGIYLRGANLFSGYWQDPDATNTALIPNPLNPQSGEKVFRTGDLAYKDSNRELYLAGRRDLQVKIRGNRVELEEIERRLLEHPLVTQAAAISINLQESTLLAVFVVLSQKELIPNTQEIRFFAQRQCPTI